MMASTSYLSHQYSVEVHSTEFLRGTELNSYSIVLILETSVFSRSNFLDLCSKMMTLKIRTNWRWIFKQWVSTSFSCASISGLVFALPSRLFPCFNIRRSFSLFVRGRLFQRLPVRAVVSGCAHVLICLPFSWPINICCEGFSKI